MFFSKKSNQPDDTPDAVKTLTATATQTLVSLTFTPVSGIGRTILSEKDGMTLVYVPAGEFTMGSDDGEPDERPVHTVYLDAFWIDQTEVTNGMYAKCIADDGCTPPAYTSSNTHDTYFGDSTYDNHPVIYVDWDQATGYCKWAGRRLPTEAEWEKAARGTDGNIYPWGNESPNANLLNYNQNAGDTTEVGKYPNGKSIYGAYDMAGNVWEWVNDWYQSGYYARLGNNASNPQGPSSGDGRLLRGGSWVDLVSSVRSAYRFVVNPANSVYLIGFRCARSP